MAEKPKAKEKQGQAQRPDSQAGRELLLLWAILGEGGGKDVSRAALDAKGMLPPDDKKARDGLENRGLITVETRMTPNEKGRPVRGTWITATKAGLAWAQENLAVMPAKSQAAAPILQAWLRRLSILLQTRSIPIAEFLGAHRGTASPESGTKVAASPLNGDSDALRAQIRQAYLELTGGRFNTRALLRDLRQKLRNIDRPALDEALKKMQREEEASLYQMDNRVEITDADRAAAIHFGDEPRHILWIER
jgi:hypothetical protein